MTFKPATWRPIAVGVWAQRLHTAPGRARAPAVQRDLAASSIVPSL